MGGEQPHPLAGRLHAAAWLSDAGHEANKDICETMITVIGNLKGGCGKSTVTFNLAVWLSLAGQDVITFDLDPQATLSDVTEVRTEEGVMPPVRVFRPESDPLRIMREHQGEVLVDVGASNMWSMRQAISQAHRLLIPVLPSQADVWSTQRFLTLVEETLAGRTPPEIILFINRADTHPGLRETDETAEVLEALPAGIAHKHMLYQRTIYRRSFSEGRAVFEMEPEGKAAEEFNEFARALFPAAGVANYHKRKPETKPVAAAPSAADARKDVKAPKKAVKKKKK